MDQLQTEGITLNKAAEELREKVDLHRSLAEQAETDEERDNHTEKADRFERWANQIEQEE